MIRSAGVAVFVALASAFAVSGASAQAGGCGGLLQPPCPTPTAVPTPTPSPAPTATPDPNTGVRVSLRVPSKPLVYTSEAPMLSGRVTRAANFGMLDVTIEVNSRHYGRLAPLPVVLVGRGSFDVRLTSGVDATYRAVVRSRISGRVLAQTPARRIRWYPEVGVANFEDDSPGNAVRLGLSTTGVAELRGADGKYFSTRRGTARRVHLYFASRRGRYADRVTSKALVASRRAAIGEHREYTAYKNVPYRLIPRDAAVFLACYRGTLIVGMLAPFNASCGKERIRIR